MDGSCLLVASRALGREADTRVATEQAERLAQSPELSERIRR
jgi:hypothetical protein